MFVTGVITSSDAISESSFHSTDAFKGHSIVNLLTITLIRKEFVIVLIPNESSNRQ